MAYTKQTNRFASQSPRRSDGFDFSAGRRDQSQPRQTDRPRPQPEVVKTWAFDSVGNRKYALQIKRASNGNPCLKIVEGVPREDGTYRRFDLTFWSEDFAALFAKLDEVRAYMKEHNIKTPPGHKYDPNRRSRWPKKSAGTSAA